MPSSPTLPPAVKLLEEKLRQNEERLRLAQRAARSGIWSWDVNTGELYWSEEAYDMLGFDTATVPSMEAWLSIILPDHRANAEKDIQRAQQEKSQYHSEFPILRRGEVRWIEAMGDFVYDSEGNATHVTGIGIDVTERKQTEQALRRSEERFRMAAQAANEAIWELDVESGTVSWNETHNKLYDPTRDSGSSTEWWIGRIHPEDRDRVKASFNAALSGPGGSWDCEYRFRKIDDTWAVVYDRASIARGVDGKATRVIGAMLDVTELNVARKQIMVLSGLLPICAECKRKHTSQVHSRNVP